MLYKDLALFYGLLDSTGKRLEKTAYISELIKKTPADELSMVILLMQGKLFPVWDSAKIGAADSVVIKSISKATGASVKEIESEWKKLGDLGSVAEMLLKKRKQVSLFPKNLSLKDVWRSLQGLAQQEGKGSVDSKTSIISDMLVNSTPGESKYIVRTIMDNLRLGVGSSSIRDGIVWAFFHEELGIRYDREKNDILLIPENRSKYNEISERVQEALDLTNDYGEVAKVIMEKGLGGIDKLSLSPGKPVNPMLFQKVKNVSDAFEAVGKPAAFEFKYDGFRIQIHKTSGKFRIFTRRLEDVTLQFPDVIEACRSISADECIIDAEAVGYDKKTGKYIAFQNISQRIRRKYDIEEMAKEFPVEVAVFDILSYNGTNYLKKPFSERRNLLEKIVHAKEKRIILANQIITDDEKKAQDFFETALRLGQEGVMAKSLDAIYKPGSRVGYGVKLKSIMDPLDLVIVGAEYGEGKRSGFLTSFYLACSSGDDLLEIGKVSTGLKELEQEDGTTFDEMTKTLRPLIKKTSGRYVEIMPEVVIEVGYEEIQKSPSYSSGYALRFPRFLRVRTDEKSLKDISTLSDVESLYDMQRGRNSFKNNP